MVGCGDESNVDLGRFVGAEWGDLAALKHPQQFGLQRHRHLADLIQEQGAAMRLEEATFSARAGAGKGAAQVTEELRLEKVRGERCAVDCDEGFVPPCAAEVKGARRELFARPRCACDQHRELCLSQPRKLLSKVTDRFRGADDLLALIGREPIFKAPRGF